MGAHCIASLKRKREDARYRAYVTDGIKGLIEMIGTLAGADVEVQRFTYEPEEEKPQESAEDVIARISKNLTEMGG